MDTIGDFLTIIRNASAARKKSCATQWSKMRQSIAEIMKNEGFIRGFKEVKDKRGFRALEVSLKYVDEEPAITTIERVSKPGCRQYFQYKEIPRVLGGLGVSILSTSKGLKRDKDARREKVGGELVCRIW